MSQSALPKNSWIACYGFFWVIFMFFLYSTNADIQMPPNDVSIWSPPSGSNRRDETLGDQIDVVSVCPSREATIDIPPSVVSKLLIPKVETEPEMLETTTPTEFRYLNGDIIDLVSYSASDGVSIIELSDDNEDIVDSATFDGMDAKHVFHPLLHHSSAHIQRLQFEHVEAACPPSSPTGRYEDLVRDWVSSAHKEAREKEFGLSSEGNVPSMDPPEGLMKLPLHPHQREGLAWLVKRENSHPIGGILADDQVRLYSTDEVLHFCCI